MTRIEFTKYRWSLAHDRMQKKKLIGESKRAEEATLLVDLKYYHFDLHCNIFLVHFTSNKTREDVCYTRSFLYFTKNI
jgi:hypothetical protein